MMNTSKIKFPLIAIAVLSLLAAMWGGLIRIGWAWNPLQTGFIVRHGALMVSGFLGTVIGVERAVALNRRWTYAAPALAALGALAALVGLPFWVASLLLVLAGIGLVAVFALIVKMETAGYTITMALGAVMWLVGNLLVFMGQPVYAAVGWWIGFLLLTVAGERLELGRILRHSKPVISLFFGATGIFAAGLILALVNAGAGARLSGAGMVMLALWLMRYDVARYTIKKEGLTKFIAACLLAGYFWLAVSGALWAAHGAVLAGLIYDAVLHAFFIGFIMSMIFGHAPIILPAVMGKQINFSRRFYSHLGLLHLSLILRVAGDLLSQSELRKWGALLNAIAILLFFANTLLAARQSAITPKSPSAVH